MNRDKFRRSWQRALKSYERRMFNIFRAYFKNAANNIPFDFLNENSYKDQLNTSIKIEGLTNAYINAYTQIGLIHGKRIGKGINRDIKNFNEFIFTSQYQRNLFEWVLKNVGYRITSVHETFIEYIAKIIAEGIADGKTIRQTAADIQKLINRRDFYRWQALRIARTESAAAANRGAIEAGSSSGIVLQKLWISGADARVRTSPPSKYDHRVLDGVRVEQNEYFNVQGELIEYPAAPVTKEGRQTNGGAVINCRCSVSLVPKRDSNGRIVRID